MIVATYECTSCGHVGSCKRGSTQIVCGGCGRTLCLWPRPTKHAPDAVDSAASSDISTTSEVSASEADSTPATTQVM